MTGLSLATPRTLVVVDAGHHSHSRTAALATAVAGAALAALTRPSAVEGTAGGRHTHRANRWVVSRVDVRDHGHDLLDALVRGHDSAGAREVVHATRRAAALVLATPCHNASMSALAKLYLDVLPRGTLEHLPVVMAVAGSSTRHTLVGDLVVRPALSLHGALPLPTCVYAADADWVTGPSHNSVGPQLDSAITPRVTQAARELTWAVSQSQRTIGSVGRPNSRTARKPATLTVSGL